MLLPSCRQLQVFDDDNTLTLSLTAQTHLICRVPAYRNLEVAHMVLVHLVVTSGGRASEPHPFTYVPLSGRPRPHGRAPPGGSPQIPSPSAAPSHPVARCRFSLHRPGATSGAGKTSREFSGGAKGTVGDRPWGVELIWSGEGLYRRQYSLFFLAITSPSGDVARSSWSHRMMSHDIMVTCHPNFPVNFSRDRSP